MPFITASNMPRARSRSAFEMVPCTGTVTAVRDLVTAGAVFGMAGVVVDGGAGAADGATGFVAGAASCAWIVFVGHTAKAKPKTNAAGRRMVSLLGNLRGKEYHIC